MSRVRDEISRKRLFVLRGKKQLAEEDSAAVLERTKEILQEL